MAGTRTVDSPIGVGVLTPELPRRHDSNYFFLERANTAAEVRGEAARILGGAGGTHRVILPFDEELGRRLEPAFLAAGWGRQRHVFMAHRREPTKDVHLSTWSEGDG